MLIVFLTDPSVGLVSQLPVGSSTVGLMINFLVSMWAVGLLHYSSRALLDYIDKEEFFKQAIKTPTGAGLALIAIAGIMIAIAIVIHSAMR